MVGFRRPESNKALKFRIIKILMKFGMKNPYEKDKALLTPEILKEKALDMRSIRSQYDYYVRKMNYLAEELQGLWTNDIQTSFLEELEKMQGTLRDFSNLTDEYAALLDMAAEELQTSSVDVDKASVLAGDGPVNVVLSSIPYLQRSRIDLKAFDPYYERTQTGVATEVTGSRKNADYLYNIFEDHVELVKYIGLRRTVEIPAELDGLPVTHIGFDCFAMAWRVRIVSVTIPDSVTTIYHGAFRGCQTIREVRLPKSLKYIGNYAFAFLTELEEIDIPQGVVSMGMGAFRGCTGLKSVIIPDSTLRIGNDCFYGCKNIERFVIGNGVVDLDAWALRSCDHLFDVTMGNQIINIGESAFFDCILLNRLDIPETVANIGETAFYQRRGMTLGVHPGSVAEQYAVENKYKVVQI
jgi:hypothetical protein